MTRRPPACHYDRHLKQRVTRDHRDDCTNPETHDGCVPCTAPHCVLCRCRHLDNDHPLTCPDCIAVVRTDLDDIRWLCRHLRWQATRGGRDGHLIAAAPIPGGDAMVLIAPAGAATIDDLIWSPSLEDDSIRRRRDGSIAPALVTPLLPLAGWDHQWRAWLGLADPAAPSVAGITHHLATRLTDIAQADDGPDWVGFARDVARIRRQLEQVLHDEQDPEQGVPCFECGDRLVRRFGDPRPCRHRTPERVALERHEARAATGRAHLTMLAGYPELRGDEYPHGWTPAEQAAARPPTSGQVTAASRPCDRCVESRTGQGGIVDPAVGQSWECTGCRRTYTPGEYANAVRAHLLTSGPGGDGWTHVTMAAEAATTQTGISVPASTVRKWMDRGRVAALCQWSPGAAWGQRLVFWPDVADQAAAAVQRAHEAEQRRRQRATQLDALRSAIAHGEDPWETGERLRIHPRTLEVMLVELDREKRVEAS